MTDEEIRRIVAQAVRDEMQAHPAKCRFAAVADEDAGHALGVVLDLGEGSTGKGIEFIRENHRWLGEMRKKSSTASSVLFVLFLTTLGGGLLSALWVGLKEIMAGDR